jgi:hypothetical protein
MSSLIEFNLLVRHPETEQIKRIGIYLEPDTRPDFPEDVPEEEADWVDAYEVVPYPERLERPDEYTLLLFYDGDDLGELPEDLANALVLSQPSMILSYSDLEDHVLFERWVDQRYESVWDVHGMYEEESELLSEEQITQLKEYEETPDKALLYLSTILK